MIQGPFGRLEEKVCEVHDWAEVPLTVSSGGFLEVEDRWSAGDEPQ